MAWQDACRAAGGFPTVFPNKPLIGGTPGDPACRFISNTSGEFSYKPAAETFTEKMTRLTAVTGDAARVATLPALEAIGNTATAAVQGATGIIPKLAGKLLGVPPWVVLLGAGWIAYRVVDSSFRRG